MYSVILVAALSTGVSAPDWHCGGGYGGCYGCSGCYGCWGGYGACYGGCYGANFGYGAWSGCYGGWGGCYGGCYGGFGGIYDALGVTGSWTCFGGYGAGCGCYGGPIIWSGATPVYAPSTPLAPTVPAYGTAPLPPENRDRSSAATKARLVVEVPAGTKLFVDEQPSKSTGERRVFSTPPLEPGQSYYYVLRVEMEKDGKTYGDSRRVIVTAGAEVTASFVEADFKALPTSTASAGSR